MNQPSRAPLSGTVAALGRGVGFLLVLAALAGRAVAGGPVEVPEINPGSLAGAMSLLTGGMLILLGRSRRK